MTMFDNLRSFNNLGRKKWSQHLDLLKSQPDAGLPENLLTDPQYSSDPAATIGASSIYLQTWDSVSKLELAAALSLMLAPLRDARVPKDTWPGIWDWLAAFYFDHLCPPSDSKSRKLHQLEWYVFSEKYDRQYKHRIAGPVEICFRHGDAADLMLATTNKSLLPSTLSQLEDEIASRQNIISSSATINVLRRLYWDQEKNQQRRGAVANTMKPGTIRRFAAIYEQLERTFDLSGIHADAILELLPQREFARWL